MQKSFKKTQKNLHISKKKHTFAKNFINMSKNNKKTITFILANGIWKNVAGDSGTLADFICKYNLQIDDRTVFARIDDNERKMCIIYKVINAIKIIIEIWTLETH